MGRFDRGMSVLEGSIGVFGANPRLAVLPLCSLLATGSGFALATGLALHFGLVASLLTNDLVKYAAMFVGIAVASSLGTFFNAAVAHCAVQYFDGETPSVRDGLAAAWDARRAIGVWALTSATVGTVLVILQDKFGAAGAIARWTFDVAWSLLTFFVVPVIVIEDTQDLRSILRQSGSAFTDTWGESVTTSLGVAMVFLPVGLGGAILLAFAYFAPLGSAAILVGAAGLLLVVAAIVASQVVGVIARVALYEYATADRRVGPLEGQDPEAIFPAD